MKKILAIVILLSLANSIMAQHTQQEKTDSVCQLVKKYFNQKNPSAIYDLAGEGFHKALSADAFKNICNQNLFPLGEMQEPVLENFSNGVSKYLVTFGTMKLSLLMSLDKADKMEAFLFKPYVDEKAIKNYSVPTSNKMQSPLDKQVDSAVQPYIKRLPTTGLSIGILKDGKTSFYGYGETARGNKEIPNEHTLFEIGSLTKTFTSILLADAVLKGKVQLDDPINKYLPNDIPALEYEGIPITLLTLANHSSGIPRMPNNFNPKNQGDPYIGYTNNDLFDFYRKFKPTRKPGEKYEYSNLAVGTLGVILERVNKEKYEPLFINTICKPLHMNETREFLLPQDSARFAKGYNEDGNFNPAWNFKSLQAAGAIRSTSSDLLKYAQANMGSAPSNLNKALQKTHAQTFSDGNNKVCLGWHLIKPGQDEVIFHNGQTGGYHSYLAINLEKKFAVVILSNCGLGTEEAGNALMKWLEKNQ
jgi:CubicO group peptidase (beta-lactamase class C family)